MSYIPFVTGGGRGFNTLAAGNTINVVIGGDGGFFTHLINFNYVNGAGASTHTGTMMRVASRTVVNGAVNTNTNSVTMTALLTDGGGNNIAASDVIAIRLNSGAWHMTTVNAVNTTSLVVTLTNVIPSPFTVLDQAQFVNYGVAGDTYHAANQLKLAASATTNVPATAGETVSLLKADSRGEPIVLSIDNVTQAGTVYYANYGLSVL